MLNKGGLEECSTIITSHVTHQEEPQKPEARKPLLPIGMFPVFQFSLMIYFFHS